MSQNKYVEYRKWIPAWGLFLDSQKEIQKMIDEYNRQGWKVVQFQYTRPNLSIGRWLLILIVMGITFGFMSYWIGVSIIFERETSPANNPTPKKTSTSKVSFGAVDVLNTPEPQIIETEESYPLDSKVEDLDRLINTTKSALFSKYNPEVSKYIDSCCSNKEEAIKLINDFGKQTGKDLIKSLSDLSSNYDSIKSYLSVFIKYQIVDEKYPHNLKV